EERGSATREGAAFKAPPEASGDSNSPVAPGDDSEEPSAAPFGPDRAAMAAGALAKARADALARGARPPTATAGNFSNERNVAQPGARGATPRRQRREDPAPLDAAIGGLVAEVGWEVALTTGSLFGRWAQIVGADLAAHTSP